MDELIVGKPDFYLAQVNIARMKAPLTDPAMADFVARIDEINALAESSPGFVWRLKPDPENEQQLVAFEQDGTLFNLSLWTSVEALKTFVYDASHKALLQARDRWFDKQESAHLALWWVPANHTPGIDEAMLRLDRLELVGAGPNAFTFAQAFPPPERRRPKKDAGDDAATKDSEDTE